MRLKTSDCLPIYQKAFELLCIKSDAYSQDNGVTHNFRKSVEDSPTPLHEGIWVRFKDKVSRIRSKLNGFQDLTEDTFESDILDGINYLVILYASVLEAKEDASMPSNILCFPTQDGYKLTPDL